MGWSDVRRESSQEGRCGAVFPLSSHFSPLFGGAMAILKVARMGHPVLRKKARPVTVEELQGSEIQTLIEDMADTMDDYRGVGLAAPQVHVSRRIVVFQAAEEEDGEGAEEAEVVALINPVIRPVSEGKVLGGEGCLSIPGLRGEVPRWERIAVESLDVRGETVSFEARGYPARVIQHEVDHLDGILFPDRMDDLRSLSFLEEYGRYGAAPDEPIQPSES